MSDLAKVQIAQLHYVEELSKQDIATRLGMSRFKVARLLAQARSDGLVRIEIDEPLPVDAPAARALERAFGLDLAVVATEPGMLARAGAAWLPEWLGDGRVLGVGWGRTLAALAAAVDPRPELRADVVQVCGAIAGLAAGTTSMEVALRLAEKLGGDAAVLAAPAVASRRARDELLANAAVAPTVARWAELDLVLAGIGGHLPGAPDTAVGHLLVHSFDADGGLLDGRPTEQAIAIDADRLRATRVMAVAGGEDKHTAVLAALRSGLLDVLVCDAATAAHALAA